MTKLSVVHFHELENYPPTVNFLRFISGKYHESISVEVLTIAGTLSPLSFNKNVKIFRLARWRSTMTRFARAWVYLKFNFLAIYRLFRFAPDAILYYETLSSGPVWLYTKIFRKKTRVFIHYHEYVSTVEYQTGMKLSKWLHQKERHMYPLVNWISHTNSDRLKLFLADVHPAVSSETHVIPNYPPVSWRREIKREKRDKLRFVYVGALNLTTLYFKEMAEFVSRYSSNCEWDIYSFQPAAEVKSYISSLGTANIHVKPGVPYDSLPAVLRHYDVGLILYKGHIPNYVYNAPNKLFEYHVCGLDVWFPTVMLGSLPFATRDTYPKIIAVDFEHLERIDLFSMTNRSGLTSKQYEFECETVFEPLAQKLTNGNSA